MPLTKPALEFIFKLSFMALAPSEKFVGLLKILKVPNALSLSFSSGVQKALITMAVIKGDREFKNAKSSKPSVSGILSSATTRSTGLDSKTSTAFLPV